MSTRSQVVLKSRAFSTPIYLYQHHDGYALYKIVCNAINRKERWNDPEYLARIIFSEMIKAGSYTDYNDKFINALDESTGFGIGTSQHGDIEYLIEVNIDNQMIYEREGYGLHWSIISTITFIDAPLTSRENLYKIT